VPQAAARPDVPFWDTRKHTLYWRGEVVKHFRADAPYQEAILSAFQRARWAPTISAQIPCGDEVFTKDRLRDTLKNLNRVARPHFRFHQEGNGGRLYWERLG
jgi:hypothetical protein